MLFSLLQPLHEIPLAFVDVETTGASADLGDRIIEIGISRVEGGQVVAEYEQLIDPGRRISAGVIALTGISQGMVAGQPTFAAQLEKMMPLLKGAAIVGHNIPFDLSFLRREFRRTGVDLPDALGAVPVLDTVRIARKRFGRGGNGLQILSRRLGIFPEVAHRALADVRTTYGVFCSMIEPVGGWGMALADALVAQGGPMGLVPKNPRENLLPLELEEALDLKKPVLMEYLDAQEMRTTRVIEPLRIRRVGGELVLIAFCQLRNARRTFKLERIVSLTRVEQGCEMPAPVPEASVGSPIDETAWAVKDEEHRLAADAAMMPAPVIAPLGAADPLASAAEAAIKNIVPAMNCSGSSTLDNGGSES